MNALDMSSDGLWLASGSTDKTVRIWDVRTGEQTQIYMHTASEHRDVGLVRRGWTPVAEPMWNGQMLAWAYATETLRSDLEDGSIRSGAGRLFAPLVALPVVGFERHASNT